MAKFQSYYRKSFEDMKDLLADAEVDADNFFDKGNQAAGKRLRAKILQIGKMAPLIRKDILEAGSKKRDD